MGRSRPPKLFSSTVVTLAAMASDAAGMQGRQMQPERLRTEPSPRAEPEMMRKDGR